MLGVPQLRFSVNRRHDLHTPSIGANSEPHDIVLHAAAQHFPSQMEPLSCCKCGSRRDPASRVMCPVPSRHPRRERWKDKKHPQKMLAAGSGFGHARSPALPNCSEAMCVAGTHPIFHRTRALKTASQTPQSNLEDPPPEPRPSNYRSGTCCKAIGHWTRAQETDGQRTRCYRRADRRK